MVALPGPPLVIIQNRSKAMIELIDGQDQHEQQHRPQPGQRDPDEALHRAGAVDARGAMQVLRHRLQARQDQQRGQRRLVPDLHQRDQVKGHRPVAEPVDRLVRSMPRSSRTALSVP